MQAGVESACFDSYADFRSEGRLSYGNAGSRSGLRFLPLRADVLLVLLAETLNRGADRAAVLSPQHDRIAGRLDEKQMTTLKAPAYLDGRKTTGLKVRSLRRGRDRSVLEITLREGRNREIRRLLARLGHKVFKLKRTAIGSLTDPGVKIGNYRILKRAEVAALLKNASAPDAEGNSPPPVPLRRRKPVRRRAGGPRGITGRRTTARAGGSRKTPGGPKQRRGRKK